MLPTYVNTRFCGILFDIMRKATEAVMQETRNSGGNEPYEQVLISHELLKKETATLTRKETEKITAKRLACAQARSMY